MKPTTSHPAPTVRTRTTRLVVAGVIALAAALSACSGGGDSTSSDAGYDTSDEQGAVGADEGGAVAQDADGAASAAGTADANRQVVQTGDVAMAVDDPRVAADAIVRLTEEAGGRIDDRAEQAETETEVGRAALTIRLPASAVSPTLVALRDIGEVESVSLEKKDVTGAAQDLDARIHAMELSVERMTALLATATTHDDILQAESALTEREATLEQMRSQRAALAEQVSLSTIHVAIVGPDLPPYIAPAAPSTGPDSFLEGLVTGWHALVVVVSGVVVVLGVLLPWIAFGGAIAALVVATTRWVRRRRGPATAQPVAAGVGTVVDPPVAPPVDPEHQQPR